MRLRSILLAVALQLAAVTACAQEVDTALVLAFDVSASVSEERFEVQRRGAAEALAAADLAETISQGRRQAVAVAVFQWSGVGEQKLVIPWTIVRTAEDAGAIAERLSAAPRAFNGSTAVGEAIYFAAGLFAGAPAAERRVIDVSGDGSYNAGRGTHVARDAAVAAGIVVNGLPILGEEEGLEAWYRENVQGGARSFTLPARSAAEFRDTLLAKLLREIS
jgi:hypothetical protein